MAKINIENITYETMIALATHEYLNNGDGLNPYDMYSHPPAERMAYELLTIINGYVALYNTGEPDANGKYPDLKKGAERWKHLHSLPPATIAIILARCFGACRIASSGLDADTEYDMIGIYCQDGENKGVYETSDDIMRSYISPLSQLFDNKKFEEIMYQLRTHAPRRERCRNQDLIAVNNGIFDYETKMLMEFNPELVFMSKSHVDYIESPANPVITMPDGELWDVESWLHSLSDDEEIVQLLWQILGAIIRPNVSWNKSAWLYSEQGNNGKGTLCALMRNICGSTAYASIPLKDFSKDFMLEPLTRVSAIIVDENDVGTYIDQAANLKAVITQDIISINRKYKSPIVHQSHGFMVQCMNEFPKVKDRSNSFYRRQLFIPMNKRFEGVERTYIKSDYLARKDVLQYVLWKVLYTTNYYKLIEPQVCKEILDEYKEYNDPIRQFFKEIEERIAWSLLPYTFLYDLYKQWFKRKQPSGTIISSQPFIKEIKQLASESSVFYVPQTDNPVRANGRMTLPEPLIIEYDVQNWMNQSYSGPDIYKKANPKMHDKKFRGLLRYDGLPVPDITKGDIDKRDYDNINNEEDNIDD